MSIRSYHASHHEEERWYNGKRRAHANEMSTIGNTLAIGTEYELDNFPWNESLDDVSDELQAAMQDTDGRTLIKCESDGSLGHGFECISYPATLGCHRTSYGWEKFFDIVTRHRAGVENNGMHVHVSRAGLGNSERAQELCIAKLVYMLDTFTQSLGRLAGRSYARTRWCYPNRADIQKNDRSDIAIYKAKKTSYSGDRDTRYRALNLTNSSTVEFRIFGVDYNREHFLARLELCEWMVTVCKSHTFTDIYDWTSFDIKRMLTELTDEKYTELKALAAEVL